MQCNNCGTPITGREIKCPGCGMSIQNQLRKKQPIQEYTYPPVAQITPTKKKNKRAIGYILFIIGIIFIIIAIFLQYSYLVNKEKEKKKKEQEKEEVIANGYIYEGYQFIIPDGFKVTKSDKYGIVLSGKDIIYTIDIDQNNSYTIYKNDFENYYKELVKDPEKLNNLYLTVLDREYIIDPIIEGEEQATMYATMNEKYNTFTGLVVKKDYSKIEPINLEVLTNILKNVKLKEHIKEEEDNSTAIKMYAFKKEDFIFE